MNKLQRPFKSKFFDIFLFASLLALILGVGQASLVWASPPSQSPGGKPGARPQNSNAPAFTIDIYPGNNSLPSTVTCGYLVLLESAAGNINNQASWSAVAIFLCNIDATHGNQLQFIIDPGSFPSVATVTFAPNATIVGSPCIGTESVTVYNTTTNIYRFHIPCATTPGPVAPREVPEADTLLLVGGGLGGIATWVGWQMSQKRRKNKVL